MSRRIYWTIEQEAELRSRYPHECTSSIAEALGRSIFSVHNKAYALGLKKSLDFMRGEPIQRHHGEQGKACRFKPGRTAWNKGMKGLDIGGKETRFKPGCKPQTWRPIGSETIDKDGYLKRKISDTGVKKVDWVYVHVHLWTRHNGPVSKGYAVVFKDGNKQRIEIDNLECIDRVELMRRNTVHNYPPEIQKTIQLIGAINRKINAKHGKTS